MRLFDLIDRGSTIADLGTRRELPSGATIHTSSTRGFLVQLVKRTSSFPPVWGDNKINNNNNKKHVCVFYDYHCLSF